MEYGNSVDTEFLQSLWISQMITNDIKKGGKNEEERVKAKVDCFEDDRVLKILIEKLSVKKKPLKVKRLKNIDQKFEIK